MRNLILGLVLTGAGLAYGGETARSLYDSEIYSQIELASINDRNRDQFLADVRAGQVGTVLLSMCDRYDEPPERKRWFAKLAREIAFFRTNGVPTLVWINGFGYGNERTGYAGKLLAQSQRLTPFRGDRKTGAVCPTDPVMRRLLVEQVRDVARAGARFILMDDDFVQTSRPGLMGCACPAHLARVSAAVGRPVGRADVVASFTGVPNPVRTAFLDVSGEIVLELARELRRTVDAVDPTIGMGICASFTHYDVEGASLPRLLEAFGGGARKLGRISGAPYWSVGGGHLPGARLEDTLEFVRLQSAWFRHAGFPMLDENDTYPRKVSCVPPWLFELYDKAVIADGNLRRHKYMLCYGADRSEPGYLEAHLADLPDDPKLRRLFAGTRPYGVRVLSPRRSLREAELPPTFMGEHPIMNMFSFPLAASLLLRNGIPCRHEGEGPAIAFGTGAFEVGERERTRGVILDRSAADILKKRGVDVAAPCFQVLDVDVRSLNFATYAKDTHREEILSALRRFSPQDGLIRLETSAPRVYSVIHRDDARGTFSVLLENMGEESAEVWIRTPAEPTILDSLRGAFSATRDGVRLKSLPPHTYAAVRFI